MNSKLNIKKSNLKKFLLYFVLLFPFFKIPYLDYNFAFMDKIYDFWLITSSLIILFIIFRKGKYSKIINYILILIGILFISSVINGTDLSVCFNNSITILVLCLIVDYGLKYDTKLFLKSFGFLLSTFIYINFISILFNPNGMYINENGFKMNWFLGYKNTHILFILPAILINFLYSYMKKQKFNFSNYLLLVVSILSTFIVDNSTGIVGLFILTLFLLFKKIFNYEKIFNIINYFILSAILFFSIIVFRVQNYFSYFIVNVLHKNITFTGRVYIWDKAIDFIKNKPLIGYGNISFKYSDVVLSTHNTILGIMHKIGIIGIISFFSIVFVSIKQLWINRNNYLCKFVSIIFLAYFIMMLTEAYSLEYYMYIFVIAYDIKFMLKKEGD